MDHTKHRRGTERTERGGLLLPCHVQWLLCKHLRVNVVTCWYLLTLRARVGSKWLQMTPESETDETRQLCHKFVLNSFTAAWVSFLCSFRFSSWVGIQVHHKKKKCTQIRQLYRKRHLQQQRSIEVWHSWIFGSSGDLKWVWMEGLKGLNSTCYGHGRSCGIQTLKSSVPSIGRAMHRQCAGVPNALKNALENGGSTARNCFAIPLSVLQFRMTFQAPSNSFQVHNFCWPLHLCFYLSREEWELIWKSQKSQALSPSFLTT